MKCSCVKQLFRLEKIGYVLSKKKEIYYKLFYNERMYRLLVFLREITSLCIVLALNPMRFQSPL